MRLLLLTVTGLMLVACAPPLEASKMSIDPLNIERMNTNKHLKSNITLGDVGVADSAKGTATIGQITPDNLRRAMLTTLMQAGYYNQDKNSSKYTLNAFLSRLEQDTFGYEMSAIASIDYSLKNNKNSKTVFSETISVPYTADIGDAFDGVMRARLATEKAVSENLTHLLVTLDKKKVK